MSRKSGIRPGRRWDVVPVGRPSRVALLLVLAHQWERLVREGVVKDYADIARLAGVTRARVTQIMNLALLAPNHQERILLRLLPKRDERTVSERALRKLVSSCEWAEQHSLLDELPVLCSSGHRADSD